MKKLIKKIPFIKKIIDGLNNENERLIFIQNELTRIPNGMKILDAGCGSQRYRKYCDHLEYYGQDFAQYNVSDKKMMNEREQEKYEYGELNYIGNIWEIEEKDAFFDVVLCTEVFEHIPYPRNYLDKAVSLLNDGGYIYITSTPNSDGLCCDLFKENWNQHEPEAHLMHFNHSHFRDYFSEKNLEYVDIQHFYRSTPYCNIENDILKVAEAINIKNNGKLIKFRSPAFYETMMSIIYKK